MGGGDLGAALGVVPGGAEGSGRGGLEVRAGDGGAVCGGDGEWRREEEKAGLSTELRGGEGGGERGVRNE